MKDVVFSKLQEVQLPMGLEKFLIYKETEEATLAGLDELIINFNVALEQKWRERFRGTTPQGFDNTQLNTNKSASTFEQTLQNEFKR